MKDLLLTVLFASCFSLISLSQNAGVEVFINEIHYDNDAGDVNESVEIAGPAGTNLSTFTLTLYTGFDGTLYATIPLSGIIPDEGFGYGTLCFPTVGLQNGSPDGLALSDASLNVQFLSYEGTFVAVNGAATGLTSTDILVEETATTPIGLSLQLIGSGTVYSDFSWTGPVTESPCSANIGQTIGTSCATASSITEVACESYISPSGIYTWNTSGIYMDTIPNNALCDSVITINLTINPLPTVTYSELNSMVCVYDNAYGLSGESPAGGTFSGTGVSGGSFDPAIAGVGNTIVTYTYSDGNNCTNVATSTIVVDGCSGVEEDVFEFNVFPNPAHEVLVVNQSGSQEIEVRLTSINGIVIEALKAEAKSITIDVSDIAKGTYILTIFNQKNFSTKTVVIN